MRINPRLPRGLQELARCFLVEMLLEKSRGRLLGLGHHEA
jgi:hypothetical protein